MGTLVLRLFVSCVAGKPVARLPLPGARGAGVTIGARREGRALVYNEREVIALSAEEVRVHGRVYERAIREGNLIRRTEEEWQAWQAAQRAAEAQTMADEAAKTTAPDGAQSGPALPAGGEKK